MPQTPPPAVSQIRISRPLVSMDTARAALALDTRGVMALIERGSIDWAFNFATEIYSRAEIRILSRSLQDYQAGTSATLPNAGDEFTAVLQTIFPMLPPARPGVVSKLRANLVATQLGICDDHAHALIAARWLRLVPGSVCRRGPGGSPEIEFASIAAFLKQRRMT